MPPTRVAIPFCILPLVMQIETQAFVAEASVLLSALESLCTETEVLITQFNLIEIMVARAQTTVDRMIADTQPVWDDSYNLCGDDTCDGSCMVCDGGEYLGEEDVDEKYCRRGKR